MVSHISPEIRSFAGSWGFNNRFSALTNLSLRDDVLSVITKEDSAHLYTQPFEYIKEIHNR